MSWFVLHPPAGVVIVSFFITARWAGQSDRVAFTDVVVEQLAQLLDEPIPANMTDAKRDFTFLELLNRAAEACHLEGKNLVLVVDGLDEDRGVTTGPDAYSIAALLPRSIPAGLRIVVAGRPNPPIPADVPARHPLRDPSIVTDLGTSAAATAVKEDMQRELTRLLHGTRIEQDLLGLLTAAGGGLSSRDLAELTSEPDWEIMSHLMTVAGRSFTTRPSRWQSDAEPDVYVLGHEELQVAASKQLGEVRLSGYRLRLHNWVKIYRDRRWPDGSPEYLFRDYFRLVMTTRREDLIIELATDPARHRRMLDITGGDMAALAEIDAAMHLASRPGDVDLTKVAVLAFHRHVQMQSNLNVPVTLPAVWEKLGRSARADALVGATRHPPRRAEMLKELARTAADMGDIRRAEELALSINDEHKRAETLGSVASRAAVDGQLAQAHILIKAIPEEGADEPKIRRDTARVWLVDALATHGLIEQAHAEVATIGEPADQVAALRAIAEALAARHENARAAAVADSAVKLAQSVAGEKWTRLALLWSIEAVAASGQADRAVAMADSAQDEWVRDMALQRVSLQLALAGDFDEAERMMSTIGSRQRADGLSDLVEAACRAGELERGERLARSIGDHLFLMAAIRHLVDAAATSGNFEEAERIARSFTSNLMSSDDKEMQAKALVAAAKAIAKAGGHNQAELIIATIPDRSWRAEAFTAAAHACADANHTAAGEVFANKAENLSRLISRQNWYASAAVQLVSALLACGRVGAAEELARSISDDRRMAKALTAVVKTLAHNGELDNATRLAESISIGNGERPRGRDRAQSYLDIAHAATVSGDFQRAERLLDCVTWADDTVFAWLHLARALTRTGGFEKARAIVSAIPNQTESVPGLPIITYWREMCMSELIAEYALVRTVGEAIHLVASVEEPYWRARALIKLIEVAGPIQGDREGSRAISAQAESMISQLASDVLDARNSALSHLAKAVAATGDLDRAEEIARSTSDEFREYACAGLIEAALSNGDIERAERYTQWTSREAGWQDTKLTAIAVAWAERGDVGQAQDIIASIVGSDAQNAAIGAVAQAVADRGGLDEAETLTRSITSPSQQATTFAALAACAPSERAQQLAAWALRIGDWADLFSILPKIHPPGVAIVADAFAEVQLWAPPETSTL